jgi:DNA-directed RNA polymerase specialized sigma24 family protein
MIDRRSEGERRHRVVLRASLDAVPAGQHAWALGGADGGQEALHRALREAVASALTERQRCLVEGYFFEGLSQGDLARRLGVAQQVVQKALFGTVRRGKRVGGALARLRAALVEHRKYSNADEAPSRGAQAR